MPSPNFSPLHSLSALGQSVWIDFLSREAIRGGHMQQLIDQDAVVGATSNPTIFQKAMSSGDAYDEQLRELDTTRRRPRILGACRAGHPRGLRLFPPDLGTGAGRDGYVSLGGRSAAGLRLVGHLPRGDPSPRCGRSPRPTRQDPRDQAGARRDRGRDRQGSLDQRHPDLFPEALRGGRRVLYSRPRAAGRRGRRPGKVASSPASSSRASTPRPTAYSARSLPGHDELKGRLAVANAKLAYRHYQRHLPGSRWDYLAGKGATPQRVLWASTSTKNPGYHDTLYVDELIGPDTVNTMPEETVRAFQDHGSPRPTLHEGFADAHDCLDGLAQPVSATTRSPTPSSARASRSSKPPSTSCLIRSRQVGHAHASVALTLRMTSRRSFPRPESEPRGYSRSCSERSASPCSCSY